MQQFENHPNQDSLIEDLNKTEEFNPFSEKSKELITSMGNTEYCELCEICSKIQCFDCALHWEADMKYCTCGPGYVRHGPSMRRCMYCKAHDMLRKARKHKSGGYKTILERWHDDDKYSDVGWTEEQIIQYDAIALEDHAYVATCQE